MCCIPQSFCLFVTCETTILCAMKRLCLGIGVLESFNVCICVLLAGLVITFVFMFAGPVCVLVFFCVHVAGACSVFICVYVRIFVCVFVCSLTSFCFTYASVFFLRLLQYL